MIRVLLVGKFPPVEGGIASKCWQLTRALRPHGIVFHGVGITMPSEYCTPADDINSSLLSTHWIAQQDSTMPWFLPGGDLLVERLSAIALDIAREFRPNIVEANYLAPYGIVASWVARQLGVPLLLRHAGSDMAKLLSRTDLYAAFSALLHAAQAVVTTEDGRFVDSYPDLATVSWRIIPRYAPDPKLFHFTCRKSSRTTPPTLLYIGKSNFHWKLRALELAAQAVAKTEGWRLKLITNGKGLANVQHVLADYALGDRLSYHDFIPPSSVPAQLRTAAAVWGFNRLGGVSDVSNVIWEAAACGVPVLCSRTEYLPEECAILQPWLHAVDDEAESVATCLKALRDMPVLEHDKWKYTVHQRYMAYVDAQLVLYRNLAESCDDV